MTDTNQTTPAEQWTSVQAYVLAVICLLVGIAGGWFIRGSQSPAAAVETASAPAPAPAMGNQAQQPPTPAQMQKMADSQAAPLIEKLKADPANAGLLASIGNIYYDTQQYPAAIDYYQRALKVEPANAGVRTTWPPRTGIPATPIPPSRNSRNRFPMNRISPTRCSTSVC